MKEKEGKKKFSIKGLYKVFITLLLISVAVLDFILFKKLNILPLKYLIAYIAICIIIMFITVKITFKKNNKNKHNILRKIWIILVTIFSIALIVLGLYLYKTHSFLSKVNDINYKMENYKVFVLKDSYYKTIEDLKDKKLEYLDIEKMNYDLAIKKLNKKIKTENILINDYEVLLTNLYNKKVDSFIIEESNLKQIYEIYPNAKEKIKSIYKFSIKIKTDYVVKKVDVSKKPFNIYISGLDTYGSIADIARSDVNMVITVNPNTHQVLLTSIPRDYYVQLKDTTGYKDKLTHSGVYGIECSTGTIENLFNTEINYYFKVNFSTLIKVINALGGVDVQNRYAFRGHEYTYFPEGNLHLNGKQALEFARTRMTLKEGDNDRIKNQQAVVNGIINKLTSKSIITKYAELLNSLSGSFLTSISSDEITSLIKLQLDGMPKGTITSNVVTGRGSSEYTHTYQRTRLYVMIPNEESITNASNLIKAVLNGEILENSYKEIDGVLSPIPGSKPVEAEQETPKEEEKEEIEEEENTEETNENENENNEENTDNNEENTNTETPPQENTEENNNTENENTEENNN